MHDPRSFSRPRAGAPRGGAGGLAAGWLLVLLVAAGSGARAAEPLPLAESSAGFGWEEGARGDTRSLDQGPLKTPITLPMATGGSRYDPFLGESTWHVQGLAQTSLGSTDGPGPAVRLSTRGDGFNVWGWAKVSGSASAANYFRFVVDPGAPAVLTAFPLQLQALASASWTGSGWSPYGGADLKVFLNAEEFYGDDALARRFTASGDGASGSLQLAETVSLDLHPGYYQPWFELSGGANCHSMAFGSNDDTHLAPTTGSSACSASVVATVRLDQAAFDADPARYGAAQAFTLADYVHLDYSANVGPVPEPQTLALWLAGLLALGGVARRRRHQD